MITIAVTIKGTLYKCNCSRFQSFNGLTARSRLSPTPRRVLQSSDRRTTVTAILVVDQYIVQLLITHCLSLEYNF